MIAMINLRSDTVTQPTQSMRHHMTNSSVGDDAYGEDKSINNLQHYCRELFNKEDALFVTSGMLSNRLAILSQTSPGDEIVLDYNYHINFFDSAAAASVCHVLLNNRFTKDGILTIDEINEALNSKPRYEYFSQIRLVSIENTINGWVGKIFPFNEMKRLRHYTQLNNMSLHLDGARLFNAHIETGISLSDYAAQADTVSVCFSKGLGAPFGSVLMGSHETIRKAKKFRMWMGGAFHQAGFQAAAALFAIKNNIDLLKNDHENAYLLKERLENISELSIHKNSGETNMIQFSLDNIGMSSTQFISNCEKEGLQLFHWLPGVVRAVTHSGISHSDILQSVEIIKKVIFHHSNKNRKEL
ncbi:MAG: threonine aldolase [Alphaproteobacteria bacterium CG_4_10_14_0_8_um_filter_37_21]|nr:MAG: threonine aldolase [Alphaproteobacteria bacterium CG_4_10_14_0_8_um_filter_37_21]